MYHRLGILCFLAPGQNETSCFASKPRGTFRGRRDLSDFWGDFCPKTVLIKLRVTVSEVFTHWADHQSPIHDLVISGQLNILGVCGLLIAYISGLKPCDLYYLGHVSCVIQILHHISKGRLGSTRII